VKVIDFHIHVGDPKDWTPWVVEFFKSRNPIYFDAIFDKLSAEKVITYLKSQGIDRAVMLAEYAPKTSGVLTNKYISEFCKGHDELIPFGSLCLYDEKPLTEQAEEAYNLLKIKGFKMLPTYAHFYPNDERLFPFYEQVQSWDIPVLFHTGTSVFKGSRVKYGDPLFLDDVADSFPHMKIILEHGGRPFWYDRAYWMITRHENVFIGITGIPIDKLLEYFPKLERYQDRFLFGSDWPGLPEIKILIDRIYSLPISNEAKEKILYKNAGRVLGLL